MARYGVPGASVAVIDGGELAWARGYGVRDADEGGEVGPDTLFQAASISKPTSALGVLRLVERGELDLDRDVNEYLTSWRVPAREGWQPRLTLRQLLSHTAGLTVHGFPGYRRDAPLPTLPQILDGQAPANTAPVRVDTLPGLHFRYSGGGTTIVQQVVEDVTGEPFARFMQREVLEPLGMTRSGYMQPLPAERWADAASAHDVGGTPTRGKAHTYPEHAAAGLWTTAGDLVRMLLAIQRIDAGQGDGFLKQTTVREMLTPQGDPQIGIGFFLAGAGPSARFQHTGGNVGFGCIALAYRTGGHGAAIMTNGDWGHFLIEELLASIAREYAWPDYPTNDLPAAATSADLSRYVGRYAVSDERQHNVALDGGRLTLTPPGQPALPLTATPANTFRAGLLELEVEFVETPEAGVVALLLKQNGREERASKS
jgi:CubicO group peptidase (beta-lactamase class C family)